MKAQRAAPFCLLVLTLAGAAGAQDRPRGNAESASPAAQALFDEARRLIGQGDFERACPKLEESNRLAPGAGTKFNLGDCYEHVGRTASAWAAFLAAAGQTKAAAQKDREKAARDRAAALEPKLCRLAIVVPTAAAGMEIRRDGELVGQAQWGEALPIDPGQHTVSATAAGKRAWKATLEVVGAGSTGKLVVPELDDEAAPAATPIAAKTTPATAAPPATAPSRSGNATLGWVLLGTGGAALVGGTIMWVLRGASISRLESACDGRACPASAADEIANGKMYSALGVGLFGLGVLGVASGAGVLLLGGKNDASPRAQLTPMATGSAQGFTVSGRF